MSQPCFNNGLCEDKIGTFECHCPQGYLGMRCEMEVRGLQCEANTCPAFATCNETQGIATCICKSENPG